MRLVAGALALVLCVPIARAEDAMTSEPGRSARPAEGPAHSKVPLRVVRILPESHQALLFDRARATHVLAEIGGKLDGYTVEDIEDDAVTLSRDGRQVVLVAPPRADRRIRDAVHDRDAVQVRSAAARPSDTAEPDPFAPYPVDPYDDAAARRVEAPGAMPASAAPSSALTIDETGEAGIRVVHAPDAPDAPIARPVVAGEGGIRVVEAPGAAPSTPAVPSTPAAVAPTAWPTPAAVPLAAASAGPGPSPVPAPETASSGIRAVAAPDAASPAVPVHPAPAASFRHPGPLPPDLPGNSFPETRDARALADVMTGDGRTRGPHPLTATPPAAAAASPVAAAPVPDEAHPGDARVISRGELDRALADFAGLTAALRGRFSASGVTVESVGEGTIFQRAGLRAGDVITSVEGVRLGSLDDAASLYARASTARGLTAQILRGGKPVTLHVVIR